MTALSVRGLSAERGGRMILSDVTFDVARGEILGVIGPNGAGKTTLFECVAGLQRSSGQIDRNDPLFYMPDAIRPWPDQTVRWTLDLFGDLYKTSPDPKGLQLESMLDQRVSSLSKGETKRLNIAIGLLTSASVLLLDEPFDGLDLRQTRAMMELLRRVERTLVLSIHQLSDAARVCDRLLLLNSGRVVATGTVEELRARSGLESIEEIFLALT